MSTRDFFIPKFCKARQWPGSEPWVVRTRAPLMLARSNEGVVAGDGPYLVIWPRSDIPEKRLEKFVQWCREVLKENGEDGWRGIKIIERGDALKIPIPEFLMMRGSSGEPGNRTGTAWEGILRPGTGKIWKIEYRSQNPEVRIKGRMEDVVLLPELDNAALDYYEEFWKRAEARKNSTTDSTENTD